VKKEIELSGIDVGKSIVMENINFAFDKATVLPETIAILDKIRDTLLKNKNLTMEVRGYTEQCRGRVLQPKTLRTPGRRRQGIPGEERDFPGTHPDQGFRQGKPIADNATEEGQAKNRRTEFFISEELKGLDFRRLLSA